MSSKRSRRRKRELAFKDYDPEKYAEMNARGPKKEDKEKEPEYVKIPGQRIVRIGSAFLLISGLLGAIIVWFSIKSINDITPEDFEAMTKLRGQTPMLYATSIALTSVSSVVQMAFGFTIFRNCRNPFFAKKTLIMCGILLALELSINIYIISQTTSSFEFASLVTGCAFPVATAWGAYKSMKFADKHPDYVPPAPTQMF